jgi:hypothetical protein
MQESCTLARGCDQDQGRRGHHPDLGPKTAPACVYNDKKVLAEAEEREYKPEDWISTWKRVDSP